MHRGGSLCCRASTTTIAGELKIVKMCSPLPVEQTGEVFWSFFYVFLKKWYKTSFRQIYRLRGAYFRDPRNGVSIDARHALRKCTTRSKCVFRDVLMYMYIFTTDRFHDFTPPNGKTPKIVKIVKNRQNWGPHSFFGHFWGGVKIVNFGVPPPPPPPQNRNFSNPLPTAPEVSIL